MIGSTPHSVHWTFFQYPCWFQKKYKVVAYTPGFESFERSPDQIFNWSELLASMSVYTTNEAYEGVHYFKVYSTLDDTANSQAYVTFSIEMILSTVRVAENIDPYFPVAVENQSVYWGEPLSYVLGTAKDVEGNNVEVSVDFGGAERFLVFKPDSNQFKILDRSTFPEDIGFYTIRIVVTDDNESDPSKVEYSFILEVKPNPYDWRTAHLLPFGYEGFYNSTKFKILPAGENITGEFDPSDPIPHIADLTHSGLLVIGWNKEMSIADDYRFIDDDFVAQRILREKELFWIPPEGYQEMYVLPALHIEVEPSELSHRENLTISSWEVIEYSKDFIWIQIYFDKPLLISQHRLFDTLKVTFWGNQWFESADRHHVRYGTILTRDIVRQLDPDSASRLDKFASILVVIVELFLLFLLVLAVLTSSTLLPWWVFINSMQLICHTPLFDTLMPGNAALFLAKLLDISRFNFLPFS